MVYPLWPLAAFRAHKNPSIGMRHHLWLAIPRLALIFTLANAINIHALQPPAVHTIDEAYALHEGLIRELRQGGYILYLRHGAVQPGTNDTRGSGEWWKDCAKTQRTSAAALPAAQVIGATLTKHRIAISDIQTSEFCRAVDTGAYLGLNIPQRNAALNAITAFESQKRTLADQAGGIINLLSTIPPPGKNRILVGHALSPTIIHPLLAHLQEGHTLVFKPEGNARFHFVAALSPGQWQFIGKQTVNDSAGIIIHATQPQATAQFAAPQVVQPSSAPQPSMIDPARELKGTALVQALRKGGYNLYMRHAQATIGQDLDLLKVPMWWENCAIQRNISDVGREQAKKVGAAIREMKLPIAEVKASQFCRVRDTATLMALGSITVTEELNHVIGQREGTDVNVLRFKLLASIPPAGKNNLLISHTHGSPRTEEQVMGGMQEAEIVVYQPDGKGAAEAVARIPALEWDNLLTQQSAIQATVISPDPSFPRRR